MWSCHCYNVEVSRDVASFMLDYRSSSICAFIIVQVLMILDRCPYHYQSVDVSQIGISPTPLGFLEFDASVNIPIII